MSAHLSGAPKFNSGTITPPTPKRASHRIAVTLRSGRDFVPGIEDPTLSTVKTVGDDGLPIPRQHMAITTAKRAPANTDVNVRTLSYGERDEADVAARIFRDSKGRVERTAEMGDEVRLDKAVGVRRTIGAKGRKSVSTATTDKGKAQRAEQDVLVQGILRQSGWDGSTPITRQMRSAALDLLAHRQQVQEYVK